MSSELFFDKEKYISAKSASKLSGYTPDYIGQLSRANKVSSKRLGKLWYVSERSLLQYLALNELENSPVHAHSIAHGVDPVITVTKDGLKKANGFFHIYYPKILSYLSGNTKNQQSLVYDYIIKRALTGSFIFLFVFGITSVYGNPIARAAEHTYKNSVISVHSISAGIQANIQKDVLSTTHSIHQSAQNVAAVALAVKSDIFHPQISQAVIPYPHMYGWNSDLHTDVQTLLFNIGTPKVSDSIIVNTKVFAIKPEHASPVSFINDAKNVTLIPLSLYVDASDLTNFYGQKVQASELAVGTHIINAIHTATSFGNQLTHLSANDIFHGLEHTYTAFGENVVGISKVAYATVSSGTQATVSKSLAFGTTTSSLAAAIAPSTDTGSPNTFDQAGNAVYVYINGLFSHIGSAASGLLRGSHVALQKTPQTPSFSPIQAATSTPVYVAANPIPQMVTPRPENVPPVITQIIQQPSVSGGSIFDLNTAFSALSKNLTDEFNARLANFAVAQTTGTGGNVTNIYQQIASSQKIDNLGNTAINNPTITGGTISGTSILASSLTVSDSVVLPTTVASKLTVATTTPGCAQFGANGEIYSVGVNCGSGVGGGSGGTFSTTTSQVAGQLINSPLNTTDVLAIGGVSTTTAKFWFDPNAAIASFAGNVGIGTTTAGTTLAVNGTASVGTSQVPLNNGNVDATLFSHNIYTDPSSTNKKVAVQGAIELAAVSAPFTNTLRGLQGIIEVAPTNTQDWTANGIFAGIVGAASAESGASGSIPNGRLASIMFDLSNNSSTFTIPNAYGLLGDYIGAGSGVITNAAGLALEKMNYATNNTSILIGTTTIPAGNYGLYDATGYNSVFSSNIGIGTSTPSAQLSINSVAGSPSFIIGSSTATSFIVDKNGNVGIGTTSPSAQLTMQGKMGSTNNILNIASSTGASYFQVKSDGQINVANGVLSGTSANDNFLNVTGTLPSVITTGTSGVNFDITSAGSSAKAQTALQATLEAGYIGSKSTLALNAINNAAGTGTSGFVGGGAANYGVLLQTLGTGTGNNTGGEFLASNSSSLNLGVTGNAISSGHSETLNVGSAGFALNATTNVAGFFGLMSTNPTLSTSAALIADNGATGSNIFQARVNGTVTNVIDGTGDLGIGTTTPKWKLTVASTTMPQIALEGADTDNIWTMRSIGSAFYLATSSPSTYATSSLSALSIDRNGIVTLASALPVGSGGTGANSFTSNGVVYGNSTNGLLVTAQGPANSILTANAGAPSFSASPTIGTSLTTPLLIGGSTASSVLTIESTSGVGTSDAIVFKTRAQIEAARFGSSGNFMIGTTTSPFTLTLASTTPILDFNDINAPANSDNWFAGNFDGVFSIGTSTSNNLIAATSTAFSISTPTPASPGTTVGIATTSPWRTLSVTGTVAFDGLTTSGAAQTNTLCLSASKEVIADTATCAVSSQRFKQDINSISASDSLTEVMKLNPVAFHYKPDFNGVLQADPNFNGEQVGFIAEQVQQVDPRLVVVETASTTFEGVSYPPGTVHTVRYDQMSALLAGAIQEVNNMVESIASSTVSTTQTSQQFAASFWSNLKSGLISWFADAANGIGNFFAKQVNTEKLCVSDSSGASTCLTKAQLDALVAGAGTSTSGAANTSDANNATSTPDITPPVISINGNNPATTTVNASYIDLGVSVRDVDGNGAVNNNLGLHYSVDGINMNNITIDTSTSTTHTIVFSAVDQAGNWGYATRTVVVQ